MKAEKTRVQESITNLSTLGRIPAEELQLNLDVVYNSILPEICSVVPMDSPRQIVSVLRLKYDSKNKQKILHADGSSNDAYYTDILNTAGAVPLDEYGYPTNHVEFEANDKTFIGAYHKILPGSVVLITENGSTKTTVTDLNMDGILRDTSGADLGTVDYFRGVFITKLTPPISVFYKFDIYDIETNRNFVKFQKDTTEMFADMYQLDADSAVSLNDFKGLNLKQNIENILPEVLAQQIDGKVLKKYFNQLDLPTTHVATFDVNSYDEPKTKLTRVYRDFSTFVGVQMGLFTSRTGVVPNKILCDPITFNMLRVGYGFVPTVDADIPYSGTPRKVGTFSTATVYLVQQNDVDKTKEGKLVITYKGPSDAQAAGIYAPYIPVTLRTVNGSEGDGMIVTNNIYSISGFNFINPMLVSGIKVSNAVVE